MRYERSQPETAASMASFLWSARITTGPSNSGSPRRLPLPGPASPRLQDNRPWLGKPCYKCLRVHRVDVALSSRRQSGQSAAKCAVEQPLNVKSAVTLFGRLQRARTT